MVVTDHKTIVHGFSLCSDAILLCFFATTLQQQSRDVICCHQFDVFNDVTTVISDVTIALAWNREMSKRS